MIYGNALNWKAASPMDQFDYTTFDKSRCYTGANYGARANFTLRVRLKNHE
jgi:hypothetical protein